MNGITPAELIRQRRKALHLTQAELAEHIHVTAKAVSKWERGAGLPDGSLIPALSRELGLSCETLLGGGIAPNPPDGGNMKRIKFYQCPLCGNILTATGAADVACCGGKLSPMTVKAADGMHRLTITDMEDEKHIAWTHPMDKEHHLTFLAAVSDGCVHLVRLYPEGAQEHRMPRIPWAKYYCGCSDERGTLFLSRPERGR